MSLLAKCNEHAVVLNKVYHNWKSSCYASYTGQCWFSFVVFFILQLLLLEQRIFMVFTTLIGTLISGLLWLLNLDFFIVFSFIQMILVAVCRPLCCWSSYLFKIKWEIRVWNTWFWTMKNVLPLWEANCLCLSCLTDKINYSFGVWLLWIMHDTVTPTNWTLVSVALLCSLVFAQFGRNTMKRHMLWYLLLMLLALHVLKIQNLH